MAHFAKKQFIRAVSFSSVVAGILFVFAMVPSASAAGPTITSIYPSSGPVGTQVTITGSGFTGGEIIDFGPGIVTADVSATQSATQIKFTIPSVLILRCSLDNPPCATTSMTITPAIYTVSLATGYTGSSTSNSVSFTVTPTTVITSISPTQGQVGTVVTLYGRGFSTNANAINFDSTSKQGVIPQLGNSSTVLKFAIPKDLIPRCAVIYPPCSPTTFKPSAGTYSVSVAPNLDYTQISNSVPFTLLSGTVSAVAPVITNITPATGTIGTQLTIKGTGFSPNLNVVDFGIGIAFANLSGNDLVLNIPTTLLPRCTFFSNPPCQTSATVTMVPGTYNVSVALDANTVSNAVPVTVTKVPLPTTVPVVSTSTSMEVGAVAPLNVRSSPSTSASIVATEASGTIGMLQAGPVVADGYDWFQITWQDGVTGWSVGNYFAAVSPALCPVNIGDTVYTFVVGGAKALTLYLRSSPSLSATISGAENNGAKGTVIGGSVVADGYQWADLKFPDGSSGWVTYNNFVDISCINLSGTFTPPPTSQGPTITFVTPQNGATVSGSVPVTVSVSSTFPISGVSFYRDNVLIGTASGAPYTVTLDATQISNGYHTLKAVASTTAGISAQASISVNVTGGLTAPIVAFVTPQNGATISGSVPLTASVSSSAPIAGVDFYLDSTLVGTATNAPYTVTLDATKVFNGTHVLRATARTTSGLSGTAFISATVTGGIPPLALPQIDVMFVTPLTGATVSGSNVPLTVTVSSSASIANVNFYDNGQLIGTANTPPYTVSWDASQVLNGWHTISATAKSTTGYTGSRSITVNVTGGLSFPVITFIAPPSGATVSGSVPVTVSVSAPNPPMTYVAIYDGSTLIGTSSASSYTATWDATKAYNGPNELIATAYTTKANIRASKALLVNVTGGLALPAISVSIPMPVAGTTVFGKIPIAATVSSTLAIAEVDFSANGSIIGTSTAPYNATWDATLVTPGTYSITATARATDGTAVSKSISVNVIAPPIFSVGEQVMVQTDSLVGLNARSGPSVNDAIVGTEPNGSLGTILNSIPVFADTYNWWDVQYSDGITGWSAEPYLVAAP